MATEVGARTSMGAVSAVSQPPMREVRLAVVMYGGVSLAVYMNGIAQELLHLVKATAPESRDSDTLLPAGVLTSTEPVYRALSQLIGAEDPGPAASPADPDSLDSRPILARFVIDVISGTSAGGINGVFLAKALANDQDLTTLGKLWIKEGDISVLLNDEGSLSDLKTTNLKLRKPPQSLLNGQRMYLKLLDAFTGMEGNQPAGPQRESRLADELDLYVTTTDLDGLLLPIQLSNRLTWERRYRNVYHFQYTTPVATGIHANDFHQGNNPFLAFAARCTSAFPWAFEPMELQDIWEVMVQFPEYADAGRGGAKGSWPEAWSGFFPDYQFDPITGLGPAPQSIAFRERAFGDGGALDNKPFTYATQTILRHQAELPVDRKLIFVEPDPGYPARSRDKE